MKKGIRLFTISLCPSKDNYFFYPFVVCDIGRRHILYHYINIHKSFWGFAFATAPLSPLGEHFLVFLVFSILSLIFFLITVLTNIFFLSYHCFTYIFLFTVLLELIFFTLQHSLGYF